MSVQPATLKATIERWPVKGDFTISRGGRTEAVVVLVEAVSDGFVGRGECVPYARYGETVEGVVAAIEGAGTIASRDELAEKLAPGAARNAIDCALWDLEAKHRGRRAWELAGLGPYEPPLTCYTLSLNTPEVMAKRASEARDHPLLKIKLGGGAADAKRMRAIRAARPEARLVADANEAWHPSELEMLLSVAAEARFELIEQPLPADHDAALAYVKRLIPVCADESAHTAEGLAALRDRYDAVNIKLDKTGGLTGALAMSAEAGQLGFKIMVGCMLATSLAMAPATLVAQSADWVDLDGPLLLAKDRPHRLEYPDSRVMPPAPELWG
jgi:L-alanine-DL-glutamate epimerase-like enolase superfamily enzyme